MESADFYLTQEGYQKLVDELEHLKNVRRREISKEIEKARAYGDLKENAEYAAAKEAQALTEQRIGELEFRLSRAKIIENENIPHGEVLIGAKVKLLDLDTKDEFEYTLVAEMESDYNQGKIAINSPVGKGLVGHKVNEEVAIAIPAGTLRYKIIAISR